MAGKFHIRHKSDIEKSRTRGANYSPEEKECLLALVAKYKDIVDDKRTNSVITKQKHDTWKIITKQFNQNVINIPRSMDSLKKFHKNIKSERKKTQATTKGNKKSSRQVQEENRLRIKEEPIYEFPKELLENHVEFCVAQDLPAGRELIDTPCNILSPEDDLVDTLVNEDINSHHTEKELSVQLAHKRLEVLELQKRLLEQELEMRKKSLNLEIQLKEAQLNSFRV